jgi:hypothetical protein
MKEDLKNDDSSTQQNKNNQSTGTSEKRNGFAEHENASPNRGGTTDMDNETLISGRSSKTERGSGLSTKKSVTGSDYDGQLST